MLQGNTSKVEEFQQQIEAKTDKIIEEAQVKVNKILKDVEEVRVKN